MKKLLAHISSLSIVFLFTFFLAFLPHLAHAADESMLSMIFGKLVDVSGTLLSPLAYALLKITSLFTYLAGVTLNYTIHYTIVEMKTHLTGLTGINTAWGVIRDIANMCFIFVLLYTAIMTIFGEGNYRRTIVNMIIAAILINFSLFFTKVVIDAGNLLALTFYDVIAPGAASSTSIGNDGIANSLMAPLQLQSIWDVAQSGFAGGKQLFIVGVMGSIFQVIAAFVMFAVSIMFIGRYIVLLFVLVLSPIYFISMILPQLDTYKKQWQEALINQTFFPVIYFILTWIIIVLMRSKDANGAPFLPTMDWSAAINGVVGPGGNVTASTSALGTIFSFCLVIGLLVISLVLAKSMASKGSYGLNKWMGEKVSGFIGRAEVSYKGKQYSVQRGIAALDEKFGEKKFAYTGAGKFIRSITTGAAASAKIGGMSSIDAKKDSDARKNKRTEIEKEERALEEAREATVVRARPEATKDEKENADSEAQRALSRISPTAFAALAKSRFFDPEFMRHANEAQFIELMKSARLTDDEKSRAAKARTQYIENELSVYADKKKKYVEERDAWRAGVANGTINPKTTPEPKAPARPLVGDIRGKGDKELEYMMQFNPDIMHNKHFLSIVRFGTIDALRRSANLTRLEKDELRKNKFSAIIECANELAAMEAKLAETTDEAEKIILEKKMEFLKSDLHKAIIGQSAGEIASMPGSGGWKMPQVIRMMTRAHLSKFNEKDKDVDDKRVIMEQLIKDLKADIPVTEQNRDAITWILDTKEGKQFYPDLAKELEEEAIKAGVISVKSKKEKAESDRKDDEE